MYIQFWVLFKRSQISHNVNICVRQLSSFFHLSEVGAVISSQIYISSRYRDNWNSSRLSTRKYISSPVPSLYGQKVKRRKEKCAIYAFHFEGKYSNLCLQTILLIIVNTANANFDINFCNIVPNCSFTNSALMVQIQTIHWRRRAWKTDGPVYWCKYA